MNAIELADTTKGVAESLIHANKILNGKNSELEVRFVVLQTSAKLLQEFLKLKKRYWMNTFGLEVTFCATAGELTKEMFKEYLKHHFERKPNNNFEVE